jgi:hypothetical protein
MLMIPVNGRTVSPSVYWAAARRYDQDHTRPAAPRLVCENAGSCAGKTIMRREWLLSVGAVVLAFLGTQHHNLMMLLFAVGLGNAAMSLMTKLPVVRDVMLAMSVVMAAVIAYRISRPRHPMAMRVAGMLSILFTLGLAGWAVLRFGL